MSADSKKEFSTQDRIWIKHINDTIDAAIAKGKLQNEGKAYGGFQLIVEFFNGDLNRAGGYFLTYCNNVRACPKDFLAFCEAKLRNFGVDTTVHAFETPEHVLNQHLQAAE